MFLMRWSHLAISSSVDRCSRVYMHAFTKKKRTTLRRRNYAITNQRFFRVYVYLLSTARVLTSLSRLQRRTFNAVSERDVALERRVVRSSSGFTLECVEETGSRMPWSFIFLIPLSLLSQTTFIYTHSSSFFLDGNEWESEEGNIIV